VNTIVKAAAVQISPVLYSRQGTVEKVVKKIGELGEQGVRFATFRMRFMEPLSFGWRMRDQAPACERRSHSSKPMRPRRASPNGTSECSSTRPPKYRASGSLTTSRGSPTAFR
jgi:hypothetical protein